PPQAIIGETLLITCGKYTYTVAMPQTMTGSTTSPTTTCLNPGEHLTLTVTLKETEIKLTATLTDWETVTAEELPINRLFNIASIEELKDFALAVNTGYDFKGMVVRLTNNISLSGSDIHIGNAQNPFRGIFDGNGKSLSDMGTTTSSYAGSLFGYADGATLRNVTFSSPYTQGQGVLVAEANNTVINNCTINGGEVNGTTNYTGALAGNLSGRSSITNCYITGTAVISTGDYVGGLVGKTEGSIAHSFATGTVTGGYFVGGLAGSAGGDVRNCYAWGDVRGSNNVGGLMGVTNSTLSHSYAAGTVTGTGQDKGGLLGSIGFSGKATNCYWSNTDTNGAGVVNLTTDTENNCAKFVLGADIIKGKLDTSNPNVWTKDTSSNKPVFIK
ncbi:MAG: GLUG motif-containing protein, partial [Tannerellaceae bacterium]